MWSVQHFYTPNYQYSHSDITSSVQQTDSSEFWPLTLIARVIELSHDKLQLKLWLGAKKTLVHLWTLMVSSPCCPSHQSS